jgi:membrane fusion protein (multidrug efflux system)
MVQTVRQTTTALPLEIVSEIKALSEVEIRSRASGLVVKLMFQPGQRVKEGQPLVTIDARAYDEAVIDAQAKLAESEAQLARARQDVARYQPLLADNAIPRQTYDQAVAQEKANAAVVQARVSGLERARLDRSYAEVRSPISGQIGLQKLEVGALATAGQTLLATVSTLDPMVAYFSVAETEYLAYMKRVQSAKKSIKNNASYPVELVLADGSVYQHTGKVDFADRALNAATGTLTLRAIFPNPQDLLRPGMSTRVRVVSDVAENVILVPQRAVTEMLGKQFATVVGPDNKAQQRPIKTGTRLGDLWLVEEGLKPGEVIVVDGLQKARPGVTVKPVEMAAQATAPATASSKP